MTSSSVFHATQRIPGPGPENRAVYDLWQEAGGPFHLHVSLHGMAVGAGPWFLLEEAWDGRLSGLQARCRERTRELGYRLHDVERHGEKDFRRLGPGFCTRPDSEAMRRHFLGRGDAETAGLFRPSSMEAVRSLGGDPLTLVSEMPLFLLPGVGEDLGPPDPAAVEWKTRIEDWRARLVGGRAAGARAAVAEEMGGAGLVAMPVRDQMILQWTLVAAGMAAVSQP